MKDGKVFVEWETGAMNEMQLNDAIELRFEGEWIDAALAEDEYGEYCFKTPHGWRLYPPNYPILVC